MKGNCVAALAPRNMYNTVANVSHHLEVDPTSICIVCVPTTPHMEVGGAPLTYLLKVRLELKDVVRVASRWPNACGDLSAQEEEGET